MTRIGNVVVLTFGFGGTVFPAPGGFLRAGMVGEAHWMRTAALLRPEERFFVFYHFKGGNEPIWKHRLNCRGGRKPT